MCIESKKLPQDFKNLKEFYEYKAKNIEIENERVDAKWNASILLEVIPKDLRIDSVLEIGFGHGLLLENVCKTLAVNRKIGVDISKAIIAIAKKELRGGEFLLTKAEHLPFKEESISLIIFCDVLEHFEHPEKALIEAKNVSEYIAVKIPLERCIKTIFLELVGKENFGLRNPSGHIHGWNRKQALRLLRNAGLRLVKYKIAVPPTEMRYRKERFESSLAKPLLVFLEKSTYKYMRRLHTLIFGSDLFAFCEKQ